jgi:acyl carrier protein
VSGAEGENRNPDVNLRDQLDLDSMHVLSFVIGLHEALWVNVPEADYPKLLTINSAIEYLAPRWHRLARPKVRSHVVSHFGAAYLPLTGREDGGAAVLKRDSSRSTRSTASI